MKFLDGASFGSIKPLALCVTPLENDVPAAGDTNVVYFGPGVHEPGVIKPVFGQTVYLPPGARKKAGVRRSTPPV